MQRQEAYQAALRAALASSGEGAEGGPPIELVGPSIAAMADYATEWVALLQSTVFEDAFLRGSCPIYGSPPLALLHSVISMGVRLSVKIAAPPTQRMEWSTWHLERAADLLSRGYFTPPTKEQRTVSDIEALQTIIIIFFSSVTAGLGVRYLPLLAKGAEIAKAVCLMGPLPASQGSFPPASNYVEWILDEMRMRAYISYFLLWVRGG